MTTPEPLSRKNLTDKMKYKLEDRQQDSPSKAHRTARRVAAGLLHNTI